MVWTCLNDRSIPQFERAFPRSQSSKCILEAWSSWPRWWATAGAVATPAGTSKTDGARGEEDADGATRWGSLDCSCGILKHSVVQFRSLGFLWQSVWNFSGLAWDGLALFNQQTGCRPCDCSRAEGFPKGGQVCQRVVFVKLVAGAT